MRYGHILLIILTAFVVFLGAGRYRASADERLESRIISDHKKIIENDEDHEKAQKVIRDRKFANCALVDNFPVVLAGICF